MNSLENVEAHLVSLHHCANIVHEQVRLHGAPKAADLTETFRHIHGAIEELAGVVRELSSRR